MQVAVIGAGASGLVAALECARQGANVTLFEAGRKAATKILKTGNGRCNLSNCAIQSASDYSQYNNPDFVKDVLGEFDCEAIKEFFKGIGVLAFEDSEGRIYPITNSAASVADALLGECRRLRVYIRTGYKVHSIRKATDEDQGRFENDGQWVVVVDDGSESAFDKVIFATGNSYKLLSRSGHRIENKSSVLGPLYTNEDYVAQLDGVRIRCNVTLKSRGEKVFEEAGEVLFRKYGVSGIVIFNCSRYATYGDEISIDLIPSLSEDELIADLEARNERYVAGKCNDRTLLAAFAGLITPQAIPALLDYCGVSLENPPEALPIEDLAFGLKNFDLMINNLPDANSAQVTRGGVSLDEIDSHTLESKMLPGAYVCGEALDIDGACGGFNLHWAWACGLRAAHSACAGESADE